MYTRDVSIDVLRCLAIVGMVLSGQIAWSDGLPVWMYHAQLPPPGFTFQPNLAGITWVDLVFPFFIFAMGVAIPLSLGRKIENGISGFRLSGSILNRGLKLALFAISLGNISPPTLQTFYGPISGNLLTILAWLLFFCMFATIPALHKRHNLILNTCGTAGLLLMLFIQSRTAAGVSLHSSDSIILILANLAVTGSFLWWMTRKSMTARICAIAVIAAFHIGASIPTSFISGLWHWSPIPWLFRTEYLDYLCILLPGTIAGEMVLARLRTVPPTEVAKHNSLLQPSQSSTEHPAQSPHKYSAILIIVLAATLSAIIVICLRGLLSRELTFTFWSTTALSLSVVLATARCRNSFYKTALLAGAVILLIGLFIEPFEGGIRKDGPTLSYHFVTAGLAFNMLTIISILADRLKLRMGFAAAVGRNPMIAYTAAGYLILPLLSLAGLAPYIAHMSAAGSWMALSKGILITGLMMATTWFFTKKKIYWKT